jgi:hypothetical protein
VTLDRDRNSANLGHYSSYQAQESNTEEKRKSETVVLVQLVGDTHPTILLTGTGKQHKRAEECETVIIVQLI